MNKFFASCPVGLEDVLITEIKDIDIVDVYEQRGGVVFKSSIDFALKLILHSRVSSRVYLSITDFNIENEKDIYEKAKAVNWFDIFDLEQSFKIKSIVSYELIKNFPKKFQNSIYVSQILKDAIVDFFRNKFNKRPSIEKNDPNISLLQRISYDCDEKVIKVELLLDLCGKPLHERGYRSRAGFAPLKENLAAGLLKMMSWNFDDQVFIDTMCGSATFLIEAALIKASIPPSFLKLDFHTWKFLDLKIFKNNEQLKISFQKEIQTCKELVYQGFQQLAQKNQKLYGSDIDGKSIVDAKKNIRNANLSNCIEVVTNDAVLAKPHSSKRGIVFCNPPYGERLGDIKKLEKLYYEYGENLKHNFAGFTAYILTGNQELRKKISLKTSFRKTIFNGSIECKLLEYKIFKFL